MSSFNRTPSISESEQSFQLPFPSVSLPPQGNGSIQEEDRTSSDFYQHSASKYREGCRMTIQLNQCCCGCSLGAGTLIIGITETIGGIINIILCIVAAVEADPDPKETESILDALDTIRVSNIVTAGIVLLFTILSFLLILGAKKNRASYLVPWMVYTCFYIFAHTVGNVIIISAYFQSQNPLIAVGIIVGYFIATALHIYFLLVVYSLYRELRGENLLYT